VRPDNFVVLLDFIQGRSRIEKNGSAPGANFEKYVPRVSVSAYDGETLQTSSDRKACELAALDPDVSLVKGPLRMMPFNARIWPVLFAHGVVPTVNKSARPDQLPTNHTTEEFEFRGDVRYKENMCIVLRTDPVASTPAVVDEFWIDPIKESGIVRYVYFSGGNNPWYRMDITYQKSENGWLPSSWVYTHSKGNKLVEIAHFTVERLEVNPTVTDGDFTLPIPPGSIVLTQNFPELGKGLDPFKPASGLSRVDVNGKWVTLEEAGFTTAEGFPLPPESRRLRWVWATIIFFGMVGIVTATILYRRWRRRFTNC
jgi:hypothetical protein